MNDDWVIETEALSRCFAGRKWAVKDLSLRVPRGGVHAFVGANGAGKSTLFRILLGFMSPSSGWARVLGCDSAALGPAERARIGFVNEEHSLPAWMRVEEVIRMQRRLYSAPGIARWREPVLDEVMGHFSIQPGQGISELSRGERAGLNLGLALAQSPELLILDEPTLGLDVVSKRAFLEALLFTGESTGATFIYCSHQMEEVERIADQLWILERGELRLSTTPDAFCERVRQWQIEFPFKAPDLRGLPGYLHSQTVDAITQLLVLDPSESMDDTLRSLGARRAVSSAVGLDRAINAFLAQTHAAPQRRETLDA